MLVHQNLYQRESRTNSQFTIFFNQKTNLQTKKPLISSLRLHSRDVQNVHDTILAVNELGATTGCILPIGYSVPWIQTSLS